MKNKGVWTITVLGLALGCPTARSQNGVNSVRVYTEPSGLNFWIDGQNFSSAVDMLWPASSKHTITSLDQDGIRVKTRYIYQGITTNLGDPAAQPISSDPSLKWIKLTFETDYALDVGLTNCPDTTQPCTSSGRVAVNGTVYDRYTELYLKEGSSVVAQAFPNAGYIFTGWGFLNGSNPPSPTAFSINLTMVAPQVLAPYFQPANGVFLNVNVQSTPPNLRVLADRTPYTAPVNLEWGWGTVHAVGSDPVQYDRGKAYVFDSWSDGGPINHDIVVPTQQTAMALTARFVPGATVSFLTSPPGLSLSVDGRQNWPTYSFVWAAGSSHNISAPVTQTDSQGRKYRFDSWSSGQTAMFTYSLAAAPVDDRITAVYQPIGQVTLNSVPSGIPFVVDESVCLTPCSIERPVGKQIQVGVPSIQKQGEDSRLLFQNWADSQETVRTIPIGADSRTYTASYQLQNHLAIMSNPPDGASFQLNPPSMDGFYNNDLPVSIQAQVNPGYRAVGWSGDLSGKSLIYALILDSPKHAVLLLDRTPAVAPLGVRNAASSNTGSNVAPGSLISIFGVSLAPDMVIGPQDVLAQVLDNVSVRVDGQFLPLLFASPGQINAQLVSGLTPGPHTLIVRWEGKAETSIEITVALNAPGLFSMNSPGGPIGLFVRENGETITMANPATPGEVVRILGTGFGPYQRTPPDGFLVEESAEYTLADPVSIFAGDKTVEPSSAGRSAMGVGIDAVRFTVPAMSSDTSLVPIRIRVSDQESNTVLLPISE
jgi:uncharacterized protein (TIGR03437 family)